MKTQKTLLVLSAVLCAMVFTGCKKEVSRTTGWEYNNAKNGGFEVRPYQEQLTGPGLVFIEGGRFTMGAVEEDVMHEIDNVPRTVTVSSFYMDETEVTNIDYLEYLWWLNRVFVPADFISVYNNALPDTTVWRERLTYNEPYVEYYLRYPSFRTFPVVGISWTQAMNYCTWRTDRVNEQLLVDAGLINMTNEPTVEGYFSTEAYLSYADYEQNSDKRLQYISTGEERNATLEDGILLPRYRLPTEAEWEYAAVALIGNTLDGRILERRTYPWNGQITRTDDKKYYGDILANTRRGRGDYMGIAGDLNDGSEYTSDVYSFWPNDFGLYNMGGNVAEWVMDVYRPMSSQDVEDLNPFRGNYYMTKKVDDEGAIEERDSIGNVPMVPVSDFKNDRRRNYRSADNRNYLDGDWASNLDQEQWKNKPSSESTTSMYDKSSYPAGTYSLVSDNARVYKGGDWKHIQYYASPGTRRYLDQDESSAFIGFRCAMSRMGGSVKAK